MNPNRTRPLSVADVVVDEPPAIPAATNGHQDRDARFEDGVRTLKVGRTSVVLSERILLILGGILAPLGLAVIGLGWYGASHTGYQFEQLPYVISGGLLGLGLVFIGCFFYFAHWLTQLVKEHREQSQAILAALERLERLL